MSRISREGIFEKGLTRQLLLAGALPLSTAGLLCVGLCAVEKGPGAFCLALTLCVLAVFVVQVGGTAWLGHRMGGRLRASGVRGDVLEELLVHFPLSVTLYVAAVAALVGPTSLIVASAAFNIDDLVGGCIATFMLCELAFLLPVLLSIRTGLRSSMRRSSTNHWRMRHTRRVRKLLIPAFVVPAALAAVLFGAFSVGVVERTRNAWLHEDLEAVARDVVRTPSSVTDLEILTRLSRFDIAAPFAAVRGEYSPEGEGLGVGVGSPILELAVDDPRVFAGIRLAVLDETAAMGFILGLLAFGVCVAVLLGRSQGRALQPQLDYLVERLDALPEKRPAAAPPALCPEIARLDEDIQRLKEIFGQMRRIQRDAIEQGRQGRELKAQFFAGMSHDLRSPLNSVIGFTDLLLKDMEGPLTEDQRRVIAQISSEADTLMSMVSDILDTSKLDAGRLELERTWTPTVELLTTCIAEANKSVTNRSVEIVGVLRPGMPPLLVDKDRMTQALTGLLSRALQFAEEGVIRIRAEVETLEGDDETFLILDVDDGNNAVSRLNRERIFKAFEASQAIPARSDAGALGLGLALARDMIRLHEGELQVHPDAKSGPLFRVILPLNQND